LSLHSRKEQVMGETKYTRAASELMRLLQVVSSENNRTAAEVNR